MSGDRSSEGTLNPRRVILVNALSQRAFGLPRRIRCENWTTSALESLRERCVMFEQAELDRRHEAIMALDLPAEERLWRSHNLMIPNHHLELIKALQRKVEAELEARWREHDSAAGAD